MLFLVLIILTTLLYWFIKRQYTYWQNFNIPSMKAEFPFGNLKTIVKKEGSFGTSIYDIYKKRSSDPFLGIYLFFRPAILVNDPVLIKNILVNDFTHFYSHGVYIDAKNDPMSENLFSMEGDDWKFLRQKLTGAFTSGKLKGMFENITEIGDQLVKHLQPYAEDNKDIEIREMASCYVADCLGIFHFPFKTPFFNYSLFISPASLAFGQEGISCIDNPNHEFKMNATRLNQDKGITGIIRRSAVFVCPR
jgi:cytochrome P450 family 6